MPDVFSKQKRSSIMSNVRSHGNERTELALIRAFRKYRIIGWRRRQHVFGKPDFVFRKEKLAIFVDGCFRHSCPLHGSIPQSNTAFWKSKLSRNLARDRLVNVTLRTNGWKVLRLWQHDISPRNIAQSIRKIMLVLGRVDQTGKL